MRPTPDTQCAPPAPANFVLSIIIANYNYAAFVGQAIDSALALDWAALEVIVVDDGSTDDSRAVIDRYADRIVTIYQDNAGHAAACASAFARSHGDIIIFLDSDDLLNPSVPREIARVWRDGVSKVQFQMKTIDQDGAELGTVFPQFYGSPTPQEIRRWVLTTSAYPTPPGSGNAYSRKLLELVFPPDGFSKFADSYCIPAAPFFGDVLTVPQPLVSYRIHGRNDGAFSSLDVDRFAREVSRGMERFAYTQRMAAKAGVDLPNSARERSLAMLTYRLASFHLAPEKHPMPRDNRWKILRDVLRAARAPQGVPLQARLALLAWSVFVMATPAPVGRSLIHWRFAPTSRPRVVQRLLRGLRIVR